MREPTGLYPRVQTDAAGSGVVSHAGAVLLIDTVRATGLDGARCALSVRSSGVGARLRCMHDDPAKILLDAAVPFAVGGDCLAEVAVLPRGQLRGRPARQASPRRCAHARAA